MSRARDAKVENGMSSQSAADRVGDVSLEISFTATRSSRLPTGSPTQGSPRLRDGGRSCQKFRATTPYGDPMAVYLTNKRWGPIFNRSVEYWQCS